MNYISKINMLNETYAFKDEDAKKEIEELQNYIDQKSQEYGVRINYKYNGSSRIGSTINAITEEVVDFDTVNPYKNRTRCTVADDGTINHFFGEEGYTEDGTDGQVMVYQPKFYYRVEPISYSISSYYNANHSYLYDCNYYISREELDGYKLHPAFIDDNGNEVDYYLIGAFEGSLVTPNDLSTIGDVSTGLLSSFSAAINGSSYPDTAYATTNLTRPQFEASAQRRGTNWHMLTYRILAAEQLLMMIEFGTMNLQGTSNNSALGGGLGTKETEDLNFKLYNSKNGGYRLGLGGSTKGSVKTDFNNYTTPIVYRGVENPWGNVNKLINGLNLCSYNVFSSGTTYYCDNAYIAKRNIFIEQTEQNGDYRYYSCGFHFTDSRGYISCMGYDESYDWVFLPTAANGNSIGIVGDYTDLYYVNTYGACFINSGSSTAKGGAFNLYSVSSTSSSPFKSQTAGTRIVYCPRTTENSYSTNLIKIASLI